MRNRMNAWIGVTVLALGVTLLALPVQPEAQRTTGIVRVAWLEVCGPGPRRPHFDIFRARLAEQGYGDARFCGGRGPKAPDETRDPRVAASHPNLVK